MAAVGVLSAVAADAAIAMRLAMVAILSEAALHALRDIAVFAAIIEDYRILPRRLSPAAAIVLPCAELLLAAGLCLGSLSRAAALFTAGLLCLFAGAIAINLVRGRRGISCGCGGGALLPLSGALVLRNMLMAAALFACAGANPVPLAAASGPALGFAAFLAVLYFAANQLIANALNLNLAVLGNIPAPARGGTGRMTALRRPVRA